MLATRTALVTPNHRRHARLVCDARHEATALAIMRSCIMAW
jgi:hypothetical protein